MRPFSTADLNAFDINEGSEEIAMAVFINTYISSGIYTTIFIHVVNAFTSEGEVDISITGIQGEGGAKLTSGITGWTMETDGNIRRQRESANIVESIIVNKTPQNKTGWLEEDNYGFVTKPTGELYMVEYSSPNTNKPLHLGHLRNNFLGDAISRIIEAAGYQVKRTNLVNDRGIHICKSMYAYKRWGKGETPETAQLKGDHLIGKYYVLFDIKRDSSAVLSRISPIYITSLLITKHPDYSGEGA